MDIAAITVHSEAGAWGERMDFRVSTNAGELIEAAASANSAAEVGRSLYQALRPYGIRALFSRSHCTDGPGNEYVYARISPTGWEALYDEKRLRGADFLPREVRRRSAPFRWSDIEFLTPAEREINEIVRDFNINDGIAVPVHGPGGYVGVTSMAFERLSEISPAQRATIAAAALVLHLQMMELSPQKGRLGPSLSPRERDCMAFVAEGKSDREIGALLGVAETTVLSHVQNAKRKLGAKSRSHAVALCILAGLILTGAIPPIA
jgi:DNA-binding CsgD family transcriptional regulator